MPVDSLMPKKKSGGTGYVVAAVVMFAAMGGLILWKASQSSAKPEPPPPPPVATPTEAPVLEAPPPPPPPPEEPKDAGAEPRATGTGATAKAGAPGPNGCGVKECSGTAGADLRGAMQSKAGQARSCYQNALRNDATLSGRLLVGVRVGTNGLACSAGITQDGLQNPQVASCVTRLFQAGKYPPPSGGCVDMAVPMNFETKP